MKWIAITSCDEVILNYLIQMRAFFYSVSKKQKNDVHESVFYGARRLELPLIVSTKKKKKKSATSTYRRIHFSTLQMSVQQVKPRAENSCISSGNWWSICFSKFPLILFFFFIFVFVCTWISKFLFDRVNAKKNDNDTVKSIQMFFFVRVCVCVTFQTSWIWLFYRVWWK